MLRPIRIRVLGWTGLTPHVLSDEQARARLAEFVGGTQYLPNSLEVVYAEQEGFLDTNEWFQFKLAPRDVPLLKACANATLRSDANDADNLLLLPGGSKPPWWRPQSLPDADLLSGDKRWFVFSAKTGVVYITDWR